MNKLFISFIFLVNLLKSFYVYASQPLAQNTAQMESSPYHVLGIGASCIDLLLSVEEDFLLHVPGTKGGCCLIEQEELNQLIQLRGAIPKIVTGGSCANTIKGLANLGESCGFVSRLGHDHLGEHFARYIKSLGVIGLFSRSLLPTAQVLCLVTPDGMRTMRTFLGCAQEMNEHFLSPNDFKAVQLVHLDAYTLYNGHLTEQAMKMAKEAGAQVSIDLSSFEVATCYREVLMDLLPKYVDIVFGNEEEVKAFTGLSPQEGCFKLQEMCPLAVVLMGSQGCLVGHQGKCFHSPAFPVHLVDSTGAGDLFASGFLYGYLRHYPLSLCARLGNRLGGAIVEVQGTELPRERWEIIQAFLQESLKEEN